MKKTRIKKVSVLQAKRERELEKIKLPKDGLCQLCHGKNQDWRGLVRAHKKRRSDGRDDRRSNIVWACAPCHFEDNWEGGHKTEVKGKPIKPVDRLPELSGYHGLRPYPKPGGSK